MTNLFAQIEGPELATILGVVLGGFGALLVGFYAFAKTQMNTARTERKEERKDFTDALQSVNTVVDKLSNNLENNTKVLKSIEAHKRIILRY